MKVLMVRIRIRIWDLPTRLFHWSLTACVLGLVITGSVGGHAMVWHFRLGYAVLGLLLFRILWGFLGGIGRAGHNFPCNLQAFGLMSEDGTQAATLQATTLWVRGRCWLCSWCWPYR